nr:hypothetical protein [Bacteroidota bacterium]
YTQIKADSCYDSLVMVFCKGKNTSKSPQYRLFNIDLKTGQYNSIDFNCDLKKNRYRYSVKFIDSLVLTKNCKDNPQIYNRLTGEFIGEIIIKYKEIMANEDIPLFCYSYLEAICSRTFSGYYGYLKGRDRKKILYFYPHFTFVKDSTGIWLDIVFWGNPNANYAPNTNIRTSLPFDWEKMEIDMNGKFQKPQEIESIKYHLSKKKWLNQKVSGYFFGFNGEKMFGYLQKKPKAFIVERVDL